MHVRVLAYAHILYVFAFVHLSVHIYCMDGDNVPLCEHGVHTRVRCVRACARACAQMLPWLLGRGGAINPSTEFHVPILTAHMQFLPLHAHVMLTIKEKSADVTHVCTTVQFVTTSTTCVRMCAVMSLQSRGFCA